MLHLWLQVAARAALYPPACDLLEACMVTLLRLIVVLGSIRKPALKQLLHT